MNWSEQERDGSEHLWHWDEHEEEGHDVALVHVKKEGSNAAGTVVG